MYTFGPMKQIAVILLIYITSVANAQLLINDGAIMYSDTNAIIKVEGGVLIDSAIMNHNGLIEIDDFYSNQVTSTTQGSGEYRVFGDWINSGVFISDTSHVVLNGANQLITGDSVSTYYNLSIENSGIKTQTINALTTNTLNLNNLQLHTDVFTMWVTNPLVGSVQYDNTFGIEGFVSSNIGGSLIRTTNSTGLYIFPTGSVGLSASSLRAAEITPTGSSITNYSVALIGNDATVDGFDVTVTAAEICSVNPVFYHRINRESGTENSDIGITYINSVDGVWRENANWTGIQWDSIGANTQGTTLTGYDVVNTAGFGTFGSLPFALSNLLPNPSILSGDTAVCGNTSGALFVDNSGWSGDYIWDVNGGTITSGAGTDSILVDFASSGTGFVTLILTDLLTGCSSVNNDTINIILSGLANDSITISDPVVGSGDIITVNNPSTDNILWEWDWDNGYGSSNQTDQLYYNDTGWYSVQLVVTNSIGCTDTNYVLVHVIGDMTLPTVFTPNSDGTNDYFSFDVSAFGEFNFIIYNRWGQVVHVMKKGDPFWDGTTLTGESCPGGTYFYTMEPENGNELAGHLTLFR